MGRYCVVCNSHNKSFSLFRFPKDRQIRQQWLVFCRLDEEDLTTATCLCSQHFDAESFVRLSNRLIPKAGALPTISGPKHLFQSPTNKRDIGGTERYVEIETRKRKISETASAEIPVPTQQEIRFGILFGFRRKLKPLEIFSECQTAYGVHAPSLVTISKWFRRFHTGHFSVEYEPREDRPKSATDGTSVALVKLTTDEDPRLTQEMIAEELGLNAKAVSRILKHDLGYTKKSARWVPPNLTEPLKEARVSLTDLSENWNDIS